MTIFKALAMLEAAVLECKKRDINPPEVTEVLDFLEPHIRPAWLVPQYRHALDEHRGLDYDREAQQQVLSPSFEGIRDSVRDLFGMRLDKLAREFTASPVSMSRKRLHGSLGNMASSRNDGSLCRSESPVHARPLGYCTG
jgi:hypothetical protein